MYTRGLVSAILAIIIMSRNGARIVLTLKLLTGKLKKGIFKQLLFFDAISFFKYRYLNWFARFIVVQKVWMGKVLASWSDLHFFLESNRSRMGEGPKGHWHVFVNGAATILERWKEHRRIIIRFQALTDKFSRIQKPYLCTKRKKRLFHFNFDTPIFMKTCLNNSPIIFC